MIGLLIAAAVISVVVGDVTDAILIALIVIANAAIGFVQEWRAEQALEALRKLSQPHARVHRDGAVEQVETQVLVPGDIIDLSAGDHVPADARIASAVNLEIVEATLTGESLPVEKSARPVDEETLLPDRTCMVHAGTAVVSGHSRAVVTATGMNTEIGHIATLLEGTESGPTPLQDRLARLSRRLAALVAIVCVVIFVTGILRESPENWDRRAVQQCRTVGRRRRPDRLADGSGTAGRSGGERDSSESGTPGVAPVGGDSVQLGSQADGNIAPNALGADRALCKGRRRTHSGANPGATTRRRKSGDGKRMNWRSAAGA